MKSLQDKIYDILKKSDHIAWLNDYKIFGEKSYVFQNKDILYELYRDYELCVNDLHISSETILYANSIGELGLCISNIYGLENAESIVEIRNFNEALSNETFINLMFNNNTIFNAITTIDAFFILTSSNGRFLNIFAKSNFDFVKKKVLLEKWNNDITFIHNIFSILTDTNYFTEKINKKYSSSDGSYNEEVEFSSLTQYGTEDYANNGFIACSLGYNSSYSANSVKFSGLRVNDELIKYLPSGSSELVTDPTAVDESTVNAIGIPVSRFIYDGTAQTAVSVYIAN